MRASVQARVVGDRIRAGRRIQSSYVGIAGQSDESRILDCDRTGHVPNVCRPSTHPVVEKVVWDDHGRTCAQQGISIAVVSNEIVQHREIAAVRYNQKSHGVWSFGMNRSVEPFADYAVAECNVVQTVIPGTGIFIDWPAHWNMVNHDIHGTRAIGGNSIHSADIDSSRLDVSDPDTDVLNDYVVGVNVQFRAAQSDTRRGRRLARDR